MAKGFLLDTNVVCETRNRHPEPGVTALLDATNSASLFVSVLTLGELRKRVVGRRRTDPASADLLARWVDGIETIFADRILPVDAAMARLWGELSASRSLPTIDTLIAATAIAGNLTLVTRNTRGVALTGVSLLDPWAN